MLLMLMLMGPENNTDLNHDASQSTDNAIGQPTSNGVQAPQDVITNTPPLISNTPQDNVDTPNPANPVPPTVNNIPKANSKKGMPIVKYIIVAIILILVIGGVAAFSYHEGQSKRVVVAAATTTKPINLPPQAIVTNSCVPGRGKQYIIPKNIPEGPIYDVENGKVIAIEYVLGIQQLLSNSNQFSSTLLLLTKNYPVDHFDVVPAPPQPGQTDEFIHLIMFVVSAKEANSITCPGTSSSSSSTSTGSTTTGSTSTGSTSTGSTSTGSTGKTTN